MRLSPLTGLAVLLLAAPLSAESSQAPGAVPAPAPEPPKAAANRVETTQAMRLLALPMKGSYTQHPAAFERISAFLTSRSVAPLGPPVARYFSDPSTPETDLAWEVGFPVASGVKAEAPFEIRDVAAGLNAIHVHKGPYEELATAWPTFVQWMMTNGYRPVGPPMNVFVGDPSSPVVELRMPIEK